MLAPSSLVVAAFRSSEDPLGALKSLAQAQYLDAYLADLDAKAVVVEEAYFDRDYLSEFVAFYGTSSAGYPNVCRRLHYFSAAINRSTFEEAVNGDEKALNEIQTTYLGFIVLRPIPSTPIGRTVLCWYPDATPKVPRVDESSRTYTCRLAGLELEVRGLAWQQQDSAVSACATVALWTMLHSSAFDDRHVVPTTAEVTQTAHRSRVSAFRPFPSKGLQLGEMIATVRDSGFAPLVVAVDPAKGFSREHFCASVAALLRSGYPVVIAGDLLDPSTSAPVGKHAVCAVGFRQASSIPPRAGMFELEDANTEFVYLHDDNLGPAVRFKIDMSLSPSVVLRAEAPAPRTGHSLPNPTASYPCFRPTALLAAAHDDVRISPDVLHQRALELAMVFLKATGNRVGFTGSVRFARLSVYLRRELATVLAGTLLGRTRLALVEQVAPMSPHVGIVRFGQGAQPLLDVIYDTTDSEPNLRAFCHVAYTSSMLALVQLVTSKLNLNLGFSISAF